MLANEASEEWLLLNARGTRRLREVGVRCEAGRFWLLWMNVYALDAFVCWSGCVGSFGSGCRAGAKRTLCTFLSASRKPTTRRDPSRSTPRRVRLGSRQIGAFFFRHIIAARARYTDYYSLPPRPRPPPRSVASLWSNQGRVLTGVRFRTDTRRSSPESIEQANQPTEELQNHTKGTETPTD